METVFLKDGRAAVLVAKTDNLFIVEILHSFTSYEGEEIIKKSGKMETVEEIFQAPPIEIFDEHLKLISRLADEKAVEVTALQLEALTLKGEIKGLKDQKTNLQKFIINRSELVNAKRIIMFNEREIAPVIMDGKTGIKFSINHVISQYEGKMRIWSYSICEEGYDGPSNYFDKNYGIYIDLTDEELLLLVRERAEKMKIDDWQLMETADKWLSLDLFRRKHSLIENEVKNEISRAKDEMEKSAKKYEQLVESNKTGSAKPSRLRKK